MHKKKRKVFFAHAIAVAAVLTLTHRHNTIQSVVAGQAPNILEWKNSTYDNSSAFILHTNTPKK